MTAFSNREERVNTFARKAPRLLEIRLVEGGATYVRRRIPFAPFITVDRNLFFARPGIGVLVTLALIAAFALITGITELVVAIGGERLVGAPLKRAFAPPRPKPQATYASHLRGGVRSALPRHSTKGSDHDNRYAKRA
jgi:hypothetical protein